jgi:hypothetical protein
VTSLPDNEKVKIPVDAQIKSENTEASVVIRFLWLIK